MTRAALKPAADATNAVREALEAAGLGDWSAISRPLDETGDHVVVLTSPDYDPTARPPRGRLFAARGEREWDGLGDAVSKAVAGALQ